jgi:5-hydroxyisourate hydrolase
MSMITTHVLDTSLGRPGSGISVRLDRVGDPPEPVATGVTDDDGRVGDLGPGRLPAGIYRLTFDTAQYYEEQGTAAFFPSVEVTFTMTGSEHYHVPVLLSPFAYSTYRGS